MLGDRDYMRPHATRGAFLGRNNEGSVVNKIIIVNVALFILQSFSSTLTSCLSLSVPTAWQFWRFGTYMFVHSPYNLMHILFNMWSLYIFGKPVEERLGPITFLKLYVSSGIIGGVSWILFNLNSTIPLVGASGAIFGVMAAAAMLFPNMQIILLFPPVTLTVKTLVICLAIINIIMIYNVNSNIAYLAHLGGLLGGYLFTRKFLSEHRRRRTYFTGGGSGIGSLVRSMKSTLTHKVSTNNKQTPDLQFITKEKTTDDDDIITSEIDPILDKIGKYGMQSLTAGEKKILERAREKLKDRS